MSINLYHGDCLEAMRLMDDNAYDLAIVDPPYGIGISSGGSYYNKKGKRPNNPHTKKDWDNQIPSAEYFEQLKRVSKNQIVWGGNYMTEHLQPSRCWIFWDKLKFVDNYADGELAWTSMDRNTKKVQIQHHGFLTKDGKSIHPTQKPVMLYEWLLDNFAEPNQRILDTHLGSGSIALACHNRGFSLDAWEIDAEYHANAVKRFNQHIAQLTIF
jgi:site-specific DNA-methyltransferase (adenine-specific)